MNFRNLEWSWMTEQELIAARAHFDLGEYPRAMDRMVTGLCMITTIISADRKHPLYEPGYASLLFNKLSCVKRALYDRLNFEGRAEWRLWEPCEDDDRMCTSWDDFEIMIMNENSGEY